MQHRTEAGPLRAATPIGSRQDVHRRPTPTPLAWGSLAADPSENLDARLIRSGLLPVDGIYLSEGSMALLLTPPVEEVVTAELVPAQSSPETHAADSSSTTSRNATRRGAPMCPPCRYGHQLRVCVNAARTSSVQADPSTLPTP